MTELKQLHQLETRQEYENAECNGCLYFRSYDSDIRVGQCRRKSPELGMEQAQWPEVEVNDWCGEWRQEIPKG